MFPARNAFACEADEPHGKWEGDSKNVQVCAVGSQASPCEAKGLLDYMVSAIEGDNAFKSNWVMVIKMPNI